MGGKQVDKVVIVIDDVYRIEVDNLHNHTLYKNVDTKDTKGELTGNQSKVILGYCPSVAVALRRYVEDVALENGTVYQNVEQYIEHLNKVYERVLELTNDIGSRVKVIYTNKKKRGQE